MKRFIYNFIPYICMTSEYIKKLVIYIYDLKLVIRLRNASITVEMSCTLPDGVYARNFPWDINLDSENFCEILCR